ncbi:MAG: metal ABC transporter permease [Bacteroidales bacterium]|nr:metal ABC transporter permease [Bacteroidales bacterium]
MNEIFDVFQYKFLTHAMLAAFLSSITCGIIGSYIVVRRMVFISGGITHASFGGIGIAYFLGVNPLIGAFGFGILTALSIEYLTKKQKLRNDSAIAILWALGMAIGIFFIYITPGYTPNLMSYLFGSILTVTQGEIINLVVLTLLLIATFILFYYIIVAVAFDEEFARTQNLPVTFINYLLIILVAVVIVLNIKVMGIILILSMLTIPQNMANLFTQNFRSIILLSIIFGFIGSFFGFILAYFLNIPSGATIVIVLAVLFLIMKGVVAVKNYRRF